MIVRSIRLENFRNIEQAKLDFSDGINVLIGKNAQGKSNILEAVYVFAQGKSFRAKNDRELIRFGEKKAVISLISKSSKKTRDDELSMEYESGGTREETKKTVKKNGVVEKKIGNLLGTFRAVLFCPEHLMLVKGGPAERRTFIDMALCQLRPVYLKQLQRYYALLSERNKLLKDAKEDRRVYDQTNELWAQQLAECAGYITRVRAEYLSMLSSEAEDCFLDMTSGDEKPEFLYKTSTGSETDAFDEKSVADRYFTLYCSEGEKELLAGMTLWGIHRDDMQITINGKEARFFASQGQDRSLVLSMKLAEGRISEKETGEAPVYLFDDVMSELDRNRRSFLLEKFKGSSQIIITSCEPEFFGEGEFRTISVSNGCYSCPEWEGQAVQ
ncbi:MAG: DNA replication/repair protein RecF [Clostridia bacterium]|nr:DNA replication/repair protein RecF [Clostridia bacterium]